MTDLEIAFEECKRENDLLIGQALLAETFGALSTIRRLKIMSVLLDSDKPVASSMIAAVTGLSEASTSYNLTALKKAGLVTPIPSGRWVLYTVNQETVEKVSQFFGTRNEIVSP